MERKDFIEQVGLSAASIMIFGCMQACSKTESGTNTNNSANTGGGGNTSTKPVDFTIDITKSPYTSLNASGGFYIEPTNNIMIARTLSSEFIAVSAACTHQQATIEFQASANRFYCSAHGSVFNSTGSATTGPATQALKKYNTTLAGNNLRVYA